MIRMNRIIIIIAFDESRRNTTQHERCGSVIVGDGQEYSCEFISLVFSYSRGDLCVEDILSLGRSSSAASVEAAGVLGSRCGCVEVNFMEGKACIKFA